MKGRLITVSSEDFHDRQFNYNNNFSFPPFRGSISRCYRQEDNQAFSPSSTLVQKKPEEQHHNGKGQFEQITAVVFQKTVERLENAQSGHYINGTCKERVLRNESGA